LTAFESLLVLLLAAVLLAAAARRVGAPYPAFLALGGAVLALLPGTPTFVLEPELALALFVAPVLLDAAYDSSPRDLRDNWAPLLGLVVVAVALTTLAVAWVTRLLVPSMPWAAAVALGAIVAPPDAAAATAVLRQLRPPHRLLTILQGESLLNDATALLLYRVAVGAVVSQGFVLADVAPTFLIAVAGSVVVGPALAWLYLWLTKDVRDPPTTIILQFIGTFGVWILAERLGLSAVLTMVCYAVAVARYAPALIPARLRVPSYAVWDTAVMILNVLAFVFIGLQLRPILEALDPSARVRYFTVAGAVLLTVILVRIVWVMAYALGVRARIRRVGFSPPRPMTAPSLRGAALVSWCGMRGIVSLAAALALPTSIGTGTFPFRDLIILTAFCVVLGTLVLQGLTLRWLLQALHLPDDDPVGREVSLARTRAFQAALESFDNDTSPAAESVRQEFDARLASVPRDRSDAPARIPHDRIRRRAIAAARGVVLEMRANKDVGDDAFHIVEEELDWLEMSGASSGQSETEP
jgi:monovalent cation/hydrogen antiporter